VLSSNPAFGIETEFAFAYGEDINIDTRDTISAGNIAQEPLRKLMFT
jgi:hypothetical protein